MSGGRFNFCGCIIRDELLVIAHAPEVVQRWPRLAQRLASLAEAIYHIEHEIDWDLSDDKGVGMDDARYELRALMRLSK